MSMRNGFGGKPITASRLLLLLVSFCAFAAWGDVYSDAVLWFRGVAKDGYNGGNAGGVIDGYYRNNDQYDVCRRAAGGNSTYSTTGIVFRTETGLQPSRYVTRTMNTLYFPQYVYITNEVNNTGRGRPSIMVINDFSNILSKASSPYSVCCRIRPDEHMPLTGYGCAFLGLGYSWKNGGMLLCMKENSSSHVLTLTVYQHDAETTMVDNVRPDWFDLVVSVDSTGIKWKFCQNPTNETVATKSGTVKLVSGSDPSIRPGRFLAIGGFSQLVGGDIPWPGNLNSEYWRCFRGSVQHVAVWNRTLSDAEMYEAMAWPRNDLMKVGIDNDSSNDFSGTAKAGGIDADDEIWNLSRTVASGDSMTIRFPLMNLWEVQANQTLKVKLTSDSASGVIAAQLNGTDLGDCTTWGSSRYWFVQKSNLIQGTNVLVLTRSDAGAGAMKIASISLGGSVQLGWVTGDGREFIHEALGFKDYYLKDGNFKDIRRALVPSSGYHNFHIEEDDDFRRLFCPHLIEYRFGGGGTGTRRPIATLWLNDTLLKTFYVPGYVTDSILLPPGALQPGDNVIKLLGENEAEGTGSCWATMDYFKISVVKPPRGMSIIVR